MSIKREWIDLNNLDFLLEAFIIQFIYNSEENNLKFISDCVNWDLERGKREFKKLTFNNVRKYERLFGAGKNLEETQNIYHADMFQRSMVYQEIKISEINENTYEIDFFFDTYFGGLKFQCENAEMETRIGVGKEVGEDKWIYRDEDTEEVFDFLNPFSPYNEVII